MTTKVARAEAKAALITINFDTGEVMHTIYRASDGYPDPIRNCEAMRASVGNDFPDHEHHIIANEAAGKAAGSRRMKDWFGINYEYPDDEPAATPVKEAGLTR